MIKKKVWSGGICLLLCVCIAFSLPACEKITAFRLVTAAFEKTAALDSFSGVMNLTVKLDMAGIALETPIHLQIKAAGLQGDSPVYSGHYDTAILGQKLESNFYSADGWNYYNDGMNKYKAKADDDSTLSDSTEILGSLRGSFSEEMLRDIQIAEGTDGLQTVEITLTGEQFKSCFRGLAETVARNFGGEALSADAFDKLTFSDVQVGIGVDANGYIAEETLAFRINGDLLDSFQTVLDIDLVMLYENPGEPVVVSAPDDPDSYKEQSGFFFGEDEDKSRDDSDSGFDWKQFFGRDEESTSGDTDPGFDWKQFFGKGKNTENKGTEERKPLPADLA